MNEFKVRKHYFIIAEQSSAFNDSFTLDAFSLRITENQAICGLNSKDVHHLIQEAV